MLLSVLYDTVLYAQSLCIAVILDAVVFYLVDQFCKILLAHCRGIAEKHGVWLIEALVLFVLSFIVTLYHHVPVLLLLLAAATVVSATPNGRVELVNFLDVLKTYWSEFKDQEESSNLAVNAIPFQTVYKNQVSEEQYKEFMQKTEDLTIINQNPAKTSGIGEGLKTLRYNETKAAYELIGIPSRTPSVAQQSKGNNGLITRRRSLHPSSIVSSSEQNADSPTVISSFLEGMESFRCKIWNVVNGNNSKPQSPHPPGLKNSGGNRCFINAVLQCIARAPNLADELAEEVKCCQSSNNAELLLLDAVSVVLQQLNVMPEHGPPAIVDTVDFIAAAAQINPDLLCAENAAQSQQDACEFLTWLFYEIHEIINESKTSGKESHSRDNSMIKLKAVYGNLSNQYIKVMVEECKKQISSVNGLSDPSLTEPVQNLSNMDWIAHKRKNVSVIDSLFTFQCIELQMCSKCSLSMVNVQTMSILALAIPLRQDTVSLEDCLAYFTEEERLQGNNGLQCEKCQNAVYHSGLKTPVVLSKFAPKCYNSFSSMPSPIQFSEDENMKGVTPFAEEFLSSTPLPASGRLSVPSVAREPQTKVLTEGIRKCLLRRLPECLTIQLMRFNYNPFTKTVCKIHNPIRIATEDFNLTSLTYDSMVEREDMSGINKQHKYSLYAICLHIGGDRTSSGHYLAYCKAADSRWYRFDDEKVQLIQDFSQEIEKPVVQENCYLLFYRRQHDSHL